MPLIRKGSQTEIGKKIEKLAEEVPAPLSWLVPDPYDPSNMVMPVGGITKTMASNYFKRLGEKVASGRIPAFHGTTLETVGKIADEGFKGASFQNILKETYNKFGVPWETRKKIPKVIRNYIEGDARQRIIGNEGGVISFAPTRNVAERWAGKGGEVAHETWQRLSEWFRAVEKKTTPEQFLNEPFGSKIPYQDLGHPTVIKAEIPLSPRQQNYMKYHLKGPEWGLKEGYNPTDVLKSFLENYLDLRVPSSKFDEVKLLKLLPKRGK
jgi:hypothetical protein